MIVLTVAGGAWNAEPPKNRPIKAVAADYVSSDSCRACHPGNYASWHASYHRTMTQVATPENVIPKMDGLELSYADTDYRVSLGAKAYVVERKPKGAPASAFGKPQQIVLLTGSHTIQIYWLETGEGRTLDQFPFSYLVSEKRWTPVQHTFLIPPGPEENLYMRGDWNTACMNCHVTHGRARPEGQGVFDSEVSDFGIACEACHSGGREHIEANRNPLRRFGLHLFGGQDKTIANPARMDGPTASLVCGQCHSIWAFNNGPDHLAWSRDGGKYRPGANALDLRSIKQPKKGEHSVHHASTMENDAADIDDQFWPDGMVRMIGRELNGVMASPCYPGGKFSCLSCHEMHPADTRPESLATWAKQQVKDGMSSNQACLQCHQSFATKLAEHTHHAPSSVGSSCYNCHMPRNIYGLLRATRSHQISSPTVRESTEFNRPNACNLCHLDRTLAWTADKLEKWYGQKAPELSADDRELSIGAQWLLKGDARQRALIAFNMGWAPAQQASGRDWMYPYLIFELNDPYAAVRFGAWKSLQTLPGFENYAFDYTMNDAQQKEALGQAYQKWWGGVRNPAGGYPWQTILEANGMFRQDVFNRLLDQRDHRKVSVAE